MDAQTMSSLKQGRQLRRLDTHFPSVYEFQQRLQVIRFDSRQHNHRMLAWCALWTKHVVSFYDTFPCYALTLEFHQEDDATFNKSNRNGLAAQRTILCAGKLRPPAAKVTSTKSPCPLNSCTAEAREELNSPQDRL